jgi:hypothetical protein
MAGTTVQLRFEYTQDGGDTCTSVRPDHLDCGVSVDNIVMTSVKSVNPNQTPTGIAPQVSALR